MGLYRWMNDESPDQGSGEEALVALVRLAQAGDQTAFDRIVRRFQDRAIGYGYSLLGDYHQAEDAVQDAFLSAFQGLRTLNEPAAFPSWLRRIVFKSCDRFRRRKALPSAPLEDASEVACRDAGPFERSQTMDTHEQIREAIQGLPESERTVVNLFYIGEHSQAEIAEFLQVPVTTVKKRLQRARARLQEGLMPMVRDALLEIAPSRNARFAEASSLLRRIDERLRREPRASAAYLAHFGRGEGFGPDDDAWSSLNVHVVVDDESLDALGMARREFVAEVGRPLLWVEAPQNAPPQGYYLMALYDGEAGPYQVDWYWHGLSGATIPADTRILFDRVDLPSSSEPTPWGYLAEEAIPLALRQARASQTEAQAWAEEARNVVSLFWAMVLVSARHVARDPKSERLPFGGMLQNLLRDLRARLGQAEASETPDAEDPRRPNAMGKLSLLRALGEEMEGLMSEATRRGAHVPFDAPPRMERFLRMVEATAAGVEA